MLSLIAATWGGSATAQCPSAWLPGDGFDMRTSMVSPSWISSMVSLPNGDIVAGGSFDSIGGVAVNNMARWNGTSWSAMGSPPFVAPILAALPNGDVVAGKYGFVLRWSGSTWVTLGSLSHPFGSNPQIWAVTGLPNGDVVAAGQGLYAGGNYCYVARWNGSAWAPVGSLPIFYPWVASSLAVRPNGNLLAGVSYTWPAGNSAEIYEWNGSTWTTFATVSQSMSGAWCGVTPHVLSNGDVVVVGGFTHLNGIPMNNLARWDGTSWSGFGTGTDGLVSQMRELSSGALVINGDFTTANGVAANGIASWNGSTFAPLGPHSGSVNGPMALAGDGTLFVGSDNFNTLSQGIARWGCGANLATHSSYGRGCYRNAVAYYERFPAATFDLSNSRITMTKTAVGYDVAYSAGAPAIHAVSAPDLGLGDDTVSAPIALPFSIPYPGGTTSQIVVGSNGCVFPTAPLAANAFYGDVPGFLNDVPRWAAMWADFDPATGAGSGTIHCDVDAVNQVVYVTWQNIAEYAQPASISTCQIALFANGNVEYRYLACSSATVSALTGWSPGGGATDPLSIDLSTWGPFSTTNAAFSVPLAHRALSRPALGTTCTLETTQIPASSLLGMTILGFTPYQPGIELSTVGMPGCYLHTSLDVLQIFTPASGVGSNSFGIPSNTALIGFQLYSQGTAWVPGVNAFGGYGMISSNAVELRVGTL